MAVSKKDLWYISTKLTRPQKQCKALDYADTSTAILNLVDKYWGHVRISILSPLLE